MTMSKKTILQIKSELDTLGVEYESNLRKADLLLLLQDKLSSELSEDSPYSPPHTRRRTMAAVDIQTVKTDILKIDSAPLNHASAVIDELEADINHSEEVSVDVQITKEEVVQDEHVVSNGTETPPASAATDGSSSDVSEDSDEELTKAVEEVVEEETIVQTRRSMRLVEKKQHVSCSSGTLFSDDELDSPEPEVDVVSVTSSEAAQSTQRRSLLFKIFIVSILFAIVSNIIAYVHLSYPHLLGNVQQSISELFKSSSDAPPAE